MKYILQTRTPLSAWTHSGPRNMSRPGQARLSMAIAGQPHTRQCQHRQFLKALEKFLPPFEAFPTCSPHPPTTGKIIPISARSEPWMLPAGHRETSKSQGGTCTFLRPLSGGRQFRTQADPRPHSPAMFLQTQGAPGLHFGESQTQHGLKLHYSLKRMDSRFLKGQERPPLQAKTLSCLWRLRPAEAGFDRDTKGKEQRRPKQ